MSDMFLQMNAEQRVVSEAAAAHNNAVIKARQESFYEGRAVNTEMGRDAFIKLLITQLSNQDPVKPMEDREFIAQMAQFSSLEQMTNLRNDFGKLSAVLSKSGAAALIGREVTINENDQQITGMVTAVATAVGGDKLKIDGRYYDSANVTEVSQAAAGEKYNQINKEE